MNNSKYNREKPDAILFDMDNTLYDFYKAKMQACRSVIDVFGRGDPDNLFSYFLFGAHGFESHRNIENYMQDLNISDINLLKTACKSYEDVKLKNIKPYAGVKKTLKLIATNGIRMAIVTDADNIQAEMRLKKAGIFQFFQFVISPDISGKRKPSPEPFILALKRLSVEPSNAWLVGDSLFRDIEPGKKLGFRTFHAKYGEMKVVHSSTVKPDFILRDFRELAEVLGFSDKIVI